jgi:hypothetical protein
MLLASFWASVAVGTVSGLIVVAVSAAMAWGIGQRGRRNREAFQEYLHRAPLRAGLSADREPGPFSLLILGHGSRAPEDAAR